MNFPPGGGGGIPVAHSQPTHGEVLRRSACEGNGQPEPKPHLPCQTLTPKRGPSKTGRSLGTKVVTSTSPVAMVATQRPIPQALVPGIDIPHSRGRTASNTKSHPPGLVSFNLVRGRRKAGGRAFFPSVRPPPPPPLGFESVSSPGRLGSSARSSPTTSKGLKGGAAALLSGREHRGVSQGPRAG